METYGAWRDHRTIRLGAGLAYYGLFAIVPLLSVSIALAGLVFNQVEIEDALTEALGNLLGTDSDQLATAAADAVDSAPTMRGLGIIGLASFVLAASLVFVALQDAFDSIWEMPYRSGARNTLRRRGLAFAVVLLSGAVLIAGFAVDAAAGLIRNLTPDNPVLLDTAATILTIAGSWALAAIVLAALFSFLTVVRVHWPIALVGGVLTALALTIGNRLVMEYLTRYGAKSLAGAAGSVLIGLVWVYAIAQIVLVGAELTRTLQLTLHGEARARDHT